MEEKGGALLAPWERANVVSRVVFHWMTPIMAKPMRLDQMLPVSQQHCVATTGARWGQAKTISEYLRVFRREVLTGLLAAIVVFAIQFFIVMFLFYQLSSYLADPTSRTAWGIGLCIIMLAANVVQNILFAVCWVEGIKLGTKSKSGFSACVTDKAMRLKFPNESLVVNLLSNDAERIFELGNFLIWTVAGPVQVITSCVLICVLLGPAGVPSFGIVGVIIVWNRFNGIKVGTIRRSALPMTDKRLGLIQELISAVKIVKIYCFENSLSEAVLNLRKTEVATLKSSSLVGSLTATLVQGNSILVSLVCLVLYVGAIGPLSVQNAFTVLSLVNGLWFPMHMLGLGQTRIGVALQSFVRLRDFLQLEEISVPERVPCDDIEAAGIVVTNATFRHDSAFSVHVDSLRLTRGLNMIVGGIGSGKSTLLLGMLGLIEMSEGTCVVKGSVSFAAQNAFIVNATVRDNIIFGSTAAFDERRYAQALEMSCLDVDINGFPDGDATEIGEKGINLSGGQRQRVSLARCMYADCQVVLLDDVLSAVDVRVGRRIFSHLEELAKRSVVILANHQLQFAPASKQIVVLHEGKMVQRGTHSELQAEGVYNEMMVNYGNEHEEEEEEEGDREEAVEEKSVGVPETKSDKVSEGAVVVPLDASKSTPHVFIKAESAASSNVKANVWSTYVKSTGGIFVVALLGMSVYMAMRTFADFWLAYFVNGNSFRVSYSVWAGVYGGLAGAALVLFYFTDLGLFFGALTASQRLHDRSFQNLLRGTMNFFDTTPIGRILNRFSKDIDSMDNAMPFAFEQLIIYALQSLSIFVAIAVVAPFILVTFLPLFFAFAFIALFLRNSNRQSRRILAVAKSFVFGLVSTSMSGIHTIRAFGRTEAWKQQMRRYLDEETASQYFSWLLGRWFNLRLDLIISFLVFFVSIISVTARNGAFGALAISYTIRLAAAFQWSIRNGLDVESQMVAVERLLEYADDAFPMEPAKGLVEPPPEWPQRGVVSFDDVSVYYRKDTPPVLKHVTFSVPGGTSLGVVGRTGAGKSTLMNCLLRLIPYQGTIRVDGVDIATVSLHRLRSSISVIPQESVIFNGTLRRNLDPSNEAGDSQIGSVLGALRLDGLMDGLDTQVSELSQGQRQLLCIARAVLHRGCVLISDESTASIDTQTDLLIQRFLVEYLGKNHVTSLTIAHRLHTVIGNDRILVLDKGKAVEFGPTKRLASQREGKLFSMIQDTGHASSRHLLERVQKSQAVNIAGGAEGGDVDVVATEFDLLKCVL